ncbi:MAG: PrsW family intramembrane metalloprotease [Paludibacteraceae bacterium]|nr:PrsW family intramembrane metalloprotease [Paludibacteraceae bacterium]
MAIKYLAALLPPILLLLFVWHKDATKEPFLQLLKAVIFGALICIPAVFWESFMGTLLFNGEEPTTIIGTTLNAFLCAAVPEETLKLIALWLVLRRNPYFDEHFDGIVYAVCVSLGFAAVENVGYVLNHEEAWVSVAVTRALMAVPGHYAFAVFMGYYYSMYHFVRHDTTTAISILLVPVLAHGIYDSLAMSSMVNPLIGGLGFVFLIFFCIKMQRVAYDRLTQMIGLDRA